MKKIYIAGPYTKGDTAVNVRNALKLANDLADKGFAPYVPHLTHFWHLVFPREYNFWLSLDNEYLPCCDALIRIPGDSNGADKEVKLANDIGLKVFYSFDELVEYYGK